MNNQPVAGAPLPSTQQQSSSPNLLERLLPTAGGILGGLVGLPLNAIDAVSGIGGTALDAGLAGAGAAGGKWLENEFTHQPGGNGVLGAAAGGAIGQGVGEGIGALGSGLMNMAGSKATSMAGDFLQGQAIPGVLGKTDATSLASQGVNDLRKIPGISSVITGENGALNQGVTKSLIADGSPVDTTGLMAKDNGSGLANDLVNNETAIGKTAGNKILGTVNKSVQNMLGGSEGMVGNQMADPLDALKQSRIFRDLASTASTAGVKTGNVEQAAVGRVYNNLASELEDRIFNPGGSPVVLSDSIKSQIIDQLAPLKDANPKIYSQMVSDVTNAQNTQDLRPLQSLWVKASGAAEKTASATDKAVGTSATDIVKGTSPAALLVAGHPLSAIGSIATSLPVADRMASSVLSRIGPAISGNVANSVVAPGVSGILGNIAGNSGNDVASQLPSTPLQINQGTPSVTLGSQPNPAGTPAGILASLPGMGGSPQLEAQAMQALMGMTDPYLMGQYGTQAAQEGAQAQKARTAEAAIPELTKEFNAAGGGQGRLGALLSRIGSFVGGGAASNYGSQANQFAQQVSQATGVPVGTVDQYVPQISQSPQVAQMNLQQLQNLLNSLGGNLAPNQMSP